MADIFREALIQYFKKERAEFEFEAALRNVHAKCPCCHDNVPICYDKAPGLYWLECPRCGLSTSKNKDFKVVTYQWTWMSHMYDNKTWMEMVDTFGNEIKGIVLPDKVIPTEKESVVDL